MSKRHLPTLVSVLFVLSLLLTGLGPAPAEPSQGTFAADIGVTPAQLDVTLQPGANTTRQLILNNNGDENLEFEARVGGALSSSAFASAGQVVTFPAERVEAGLRESIAAAGEGDFLVYLQAQADLSPAYAITDWEARGRFVYETLWNTAQATQGDLLAYLEAEQAAGMVQEIHPYYIVNSIGVRGNEVVLDALAGRADVAYLEGLETYSIPEPTPETENEINAIEWGVARIGADQIWTDFGVRGEGVVVANIDTGVLYTHASLQNQYRGTASGSHDFNWFDPNGASAPFDNNGHGSHTMGTMVGDDGGSNQIGVAPGARWIAAKGCASNSCSSNDLLSSAEWVLAPYPVGGNPSQADPAMRPHVVNNSWGGGGGDTWYQASVNAWRAANIFPAFSAGNSGPFSGTIGSPGDYAASFAVGATNSSDGIASFSSRGPSSLTNETKPDVSAPGVSIRSAWNSGGYNTIDGTSMASPHVAGCVALIQSAAPELEITVIEDLLTGTAVDLGSSGPDTTYGYGRIDCHAALSQATAFWMGVTPLEGSVAAGGSTTVTVSFDATGLNEGEFQGAVYFYSNDPDESPLTVPVTLTISDTPVTPGPTDTPPPTNTQTPTSTPTATDVPTDTPPPPTDTPTDAPTATDVPTETPEPGVVFADDFENPGGWIVDPDGTDGATTGIWERANPEDTSYQGLPYQLGTAFQGSFDLSTGPEAGASVGDDDIDGGITTIRSPAIDLPAGADFELQFAYYLAHFSNAGSDDFLRIRIIDPIDRIVVFEELGQGSIRSAAWETATVDLSVYSGLTIWLQIEAADNGAGSLVEAAIDEIVIRQIETAPTPTPTDPPPPTATPTDTPPGPIFADDFESDSGWLANPDGADTATTGLWARGNPEQTSYNGLTYQLGTTFNGSFDLSTGPSAGSSVGANDIDGGQTSIRSPEITLPSSSGLELSFAYYLAHLSNATSADYLRISVLTAAGDSVTVFERLATSSNVPAAWNTASTSLDAFAGQTISLLIEAADAGSGSLVEAAIDDLRITGP